MSNDTGELSDDRLTNTRRASKESDERRPLRCSINFTLERLLPAPSWRLPEDEESTRHWTAQIERADALLFGRVSHEVMRRRAAEADRGHVARLDG